MTIRQLALNQRSACFELDCGPKAIYNAPCSYDVYLNGARCTSGDTNVFSLYGLAPAMSYKLRVAFAGGQSISHEFITPPEYICLDVRQFGCVGDGIADDTNGLQAAIDACPKGGTVYVGKGIYLSYPLFLRGGILLYLDEGAVLLGGTQRARYPILPGMAQAADGSEQSFATWEGNPLDSYASLLTIIDAKDVSIAGPGLVDANAQNADWWENPKQKRGAWRPRTVFAVRAQNLTLLGISLRNSPAWTIHPYCCKGVDILDVNIKNPPDSPNTDGCNPESCEDVRIIGADISVGDDCISVKSGKYYMATHHPAPARNISVRNCLLRRGHGAVVVGSETSSGVQGLTVERCLMRDTDRGLRIKTRRGRGSTSVVDEVLLSDIAMERVLAPFVVNMFYYCDPDGHTDIVQDKSYRPADALTPSVRSIRCQNIRCTGAQQSGAFLYGLPESPLAHFEMQNVSISFAENAISGMPAMMDGMEPIKKQALYAVNVRQLLLKDVVFEGYEGDCCHLEAVESFTKEFKDAKEETSDGKIPSFAVVAPIL